MAEKSLDLQTLAKRIEKVERQNRGLKLVGGLALLLAGTFFLLGIKPITKTGEVYTARSFSLIDNSGFARAIFSVDDSGKPSLTFAEPKDGSAKVLMGFSFDDAGEPYLMLMGKKGGGIKINPKQIGIISEQGKVVWHTP